MKIRAPIVVLAALQAVAGAQSYNDFTIVRDRPSPWASVLAVRAGLLGGLTNDENPLKGAEDELSWDGFIYYREDRFGGEEALLDAYAGRDGAYFGVRQGGLLGGEAQSRLEVMTRYFPFYREGYYNDGDFVPTGRYEGLDYGIELGAAQAMQEGLRMEVTSFFRRMTFEENEDTRDDGYTIPDNYNAFGGRLSFEHNTLTLDRYGILPRQGFILTLVGDYEQNDSDRRFGRPGIFESTLPRRAYRARGHLEWFVPQSDALTWRVQVDGSLSDTKDRVYNYDAQKPVGHAWVDGDIGLRLDLGQALSLTPYLGGQFIRILEDSGVGSSKETFFGGGLDLQIDFGDNLSILGWYSYLDNESRAPVSTSADTLGEHQFFVGMEVRLAASRR